MYACRTEFVNKIYCFFEITQIIENAKITVVIKKSPNAAVAVNSDKFIFMNTLENINYFSD